MHTLFSENGEGQKRQTCPQLSSETVIWIIIKNFYKLSEKINQYLLRYAKIVIKHVITLNLTMSKKGNLIVINWGIS
jgi:hypothetical protein